MLQQNLTPEDFKKCEWQEIVYSADKHDCFSYSQLFDQRAKELSTTDLTCTSVFIFLSCTSSMHLRVENKKEPFVEFASFDGKRTTNLSDFTEEDLNLISFILHESSLSDPELIARLGDILWVKRKDHVSANRAYINYLKSAEALRNSSRPYLANDRLERAIQIGWSIGKDHFDKAIKLVERLIEETEPQSYSSNDQALIQILYKYQQGDAVKIAKNCELSAQTAENTRNWERADLYWELASLWFVRAKDFGKSRVSLERLSQAKISRARELLSSQTPSFMQAAELIRQSIETLRKAGRNDERIMALHKEFVEYQNKSTAEFVQVSGEMDFSDIAHQARKMVKDENLLQALAKLASIHRPPSLDALRHSLEEQIKDFPFLHAISSIVVGESGQTLARGEPTLQTGVKEDAIEARLVRIAAEEQQMVSAAVLEPARTAILFDHPNMALNNLLPLLLQNDFVPEKRITYFVNGIHAGLNAEFLIALHVLIPQIENSLRHILRIRGIVVTGLDDNGIQEDFGLSKLLKIEEAKALLGEETLFDLRVLLIESAGLNLRNRLSHGQIDPETFKQPQFTYAWWVVLRLCFIGKNLWNQRNQSSKANSASNSPK